MTNTCISAGNKLWAASLTSTVSPDMMFGGARLRVVVYGDRDDARRGGLVRGRMELRHVRVRQRLLRTQPPRRVEHQQPPQQVQRILAAQQAAQKGLSFWGGKPCINRSSTSSQNRVSRHEQNLNTPHWSFLQRNIRWHPGQVLRVCATGSHHVKRCLHGQVRPARGFWLPTEHTLQLTGQELTASTWPPGRACAAPWGARRAASPASSPQTASAPRPRPLCWAALPRAGALRITPFMYALQCRVPSLIALSRLMQSEQRFLMNPMY